ncbi:DUF3500 domain-containing protein [Streptomyces fuscichromogenes]|uniref:DUF3500 domain-containing protein n=1 Tax=Streptomyces fuscichromogenes TaxID=1324013 RepID=UPI0037F7E9CE
MPEVRGHLDATHVTWAGGTAGADAFYVRVHSPVVWVEVDCQAPGPLAGAYGIASAVQEPLHNGPHVRVVPNYLTAHGDQVLRGLDDDLTGTGTTRLTSRISSWPSMSRLGTSPVIRTTTRTTSRTGRPSSRQLHRRARRCG